MNLPKIYEPKQYEGDIYALWESSGAFKPSGKGEPYSIVMPPPNANANLHIGTGLTIAIQDVLTRYYRMKGRRTLYLPGADHAGFETWVVYEKHLNKEGKSRFDYTREELYQGVWDFVANNRGNMELQMRQIGASADWSRFTFTLDSNIVSRAYKTFEKMWQDGLIYRGERIVNYCTLHDTSFSDIEVEYKDEKSHLWEIRYPAKDGEGEVIVATTRPETLLGDTAVAVNPEDERYKQLVGKQVMVPLVDRLVKVVADEMVDFEFGTGAVKITPAHDPNDFEVGQRHNLENISVIGFDGKMTDNAPKKYHGMTVTEARKAVVEDLKSGGYLVSETPYKHSVGHCYKCGTVIEPLLKDQWFVKMKPLATEAIKALRGKKVKIIPESRTKSGIAYLENIKDWNISRQIAWGIPIPAFQNVDDSSDWIFDDRVDKETIEVKGKTYRRDPDVFDTWFSSGQWPFATLNFPDSEDFKEFYPLSVMETGGEIFNQWVLRMLMLGLYITKEVPFKDVYIHGYVMAEDGSKMSKSKGNVVDPREIITKYGSDGLRIGIISGRRAGVNQNFSPARFTAGRNFCNKLWNIARYIEGVVGEQVAENDRTPNPVSLADHWIVRELNQAADEIAAHMEAYRFAEAFEAVYHTIWDKMADWYLEASKVAPNASTAVWALETCLKIAHPFAPFVTETIWQTLQWDEGQLISNKWPEVEAFDANLAKQFEQLQNIITETREVLGIIGSTDVALTTTTSQLILENSELLRRMARVGYVEPVDEESGLRLTSTHEHAWLDLSQEQIQRFKQTLEKKLTEAETIIHALEHRLSNERYVASAPEELVEESRQQLKQKTTQAEHLRHQLKHLL